MTTGKPTGVRASGFIEHADGVATSCAPWIPPLCAALAWRLQQLHQAYLRVKFFKMQRRNLKKP